MQIEPRNEYVVVSVKKAAERHSGIVIPGQEMERNLVTVVAVGPGGITSEGRRNPIEVAAGVPLKKGDVVFLKNGEFEHFEHDGLPHFIVPQGAIIGIEIPGT